MSEVAARLKLKKSPKAEKSHIKNNSNGDPVDNQAFPKLCKNRNEEHFGVIKKFTGCKCPKKFRAEL